MKEVKEQRWAQALGEWNGMLDCGVREDRENFDFGGGFC